MKQIVTKTQTLVFWGCLLLTAKAVFGGDDTAKDVVVANADKLLSPQREERDYALRALAQQYDAVSVVCRNALANSASQSREDRRYHSPLHAAILAVRTWHVVDAESELLSVIDYTLDIHSVPVGKDLSGDFFFPAASALAYLRPNANKLESAINVADTPKKLRLLTWVLVQREGNIEKAKTVLSAVRAKNAGGVARQNLDAALMFLDSPSDLLPSFTEVK